MFFVGLAFLALSVVLVLIANRNEGYDKRVGYEYAAWVAFVIAAVFFFGEVFAT